MHILKRELSRGWYSLHKRIDFSKIASVSLVDKNDLEYRDWLNTLINNNKNKNGRGNNKRFFIMEKYPDIFQYIKNLWNSGEYENAESKKDLYMCQNCNHCSVDKYRVGSFVCWHGYISGKPKKTNLTSSCNAFQLKIFPDKTNYVWNILKRRLDLSTSNFGNLGIYPGNFKFFLKDMGLIDNIKLGWTVGKENEKDFFEKIKIIDSSIVFLPTIFKIKYNNGQKINFNILDGFIQLPLGEMCIIEFKSASYYQDDNQNNDYLSLFNMCKYPISEQGCYYLSIYKEGFYDNGSYVLDKLYSIPYINKISDKTFFDIIKYQSDIIFSGEIKKRKLFEF